MSTIGTSAGSRVRRRAATCAWFIALAAVVATPTSPAEAASAKLYVGTNGTDNADCGPVGRSPCRSISRAIAHANPGDQIIVGPGVYGDVDRDRDVDPSGDSGEEAPTSIPPVALLSGTVSLAMINIDKPLTIVSRDGAGATVIDASGQFVNGSLVAVNAAAEGIVFGKTRKGFTIRNAALGVYVDVPGVTVGGTMVDTCHYGFLAGSPSGVSGAALGTVLKGNVATNTSVGGFTINDESAVVRGNLAKANFFLGFGVLGSSAGEITKNLAIGNFGYGFLLAATGTTMTFSKNASIGNTDAGLFVVSTGAAPIAMTVQQNTIYGNGVYPQYPPMNCGLVIQNAGAEMLTVNADGNYWGAESGPGNDPADAAGGLCRAGVVTLNLTSSASNEIKVKAPTM